MDEWENDFEIDEKYEDLRDYSFICRTVHTDQRKRRPSREHTWQTKRLREYIKRLEKALNYTVIAEGIVSEMSVYSSVYPNELKIDFSVTPTDTVLTREITRSMLNRKSFTIIIKESE